MNQPTSNGPVLGPEQIAAPRPPLPMLPIDLLDACGNGYTVADLARVLAANTRLVGSTEPA